MPGVLAEVVGRIDDDRFRRHTGRQRRSCQRRGDRDRVGDDIVVLDPIGTGARYQSAGVGADDGGAVLRRDVDELGVGAAPRVVEHVGAGRADRVADRGPPGVDRDDQTGVELADAGHEVDHSRLLLRLADLRATELRGDLATAEESARAAARAEAEYLERAREIAERELELRHHNDLDAAFTELRGELNAQVRPELSELASLFLAQLTDGRYTSLEIDEAYNILILDEGEEKPVISGGEEDIANLVLRLSLSQMIAERAGHPLSLLILDEVFGSLDVARRDNVVQLLRRLDDRFDQVILITHVEGLRESLDQVLTVSFDERTGTSLVREEKREG